MAKKGQTENNANVCTAERKNIKQQMAHLE